MDQSTTWKNAVLLVVLLSCARLQLATAEDVGTVKTAPERVTIEQLTRPCANKNAAPCVITIAEPLKLIVTRTRLPPALELDFGDHGSWEVMGDTLDLNQAQVTSTGSHQLFFGTASIHGLTASRPEWFAAAPSRDDAYPADAIRRAVRALTPNGVLQLSNAVYTSPFFDPDAASPCSGKTLAVTDKLTIQGVRRPVPDSEMAPTRLQAGSILRGEICGTGELHISHLGVDEGPFSLKHDFHGKPAFGIQLASTGQLGSVHGTTIEDVSVLTNGMQDQHSVIVEGQRDALIKNLWIWSLGGTHGLVVKSLHTVVDGFHCAGAAADCLILKADFATDRAGNASGSSVSHVDIHSLAHAGDTGGIELDGRWDSLANISLTGIEERGLRYGIVTDDSLFYAVSDVRIQNWKAEDLIGPCLVVNGSRDVSVTQFRCSSSKDPGSPLFFLHGARTNLTDGAVICSGGTTCETWTSDGIADRGRGDHIRDITGDRLGGYLVGATSQHATQATLATHDMNNRTWHHVPAPLRSEIVSSFYLAKGAIRIALTHLSTWDGPFAVPLCLVLLCGAGVTTALVLRRSAAGHDGTGGGS